VHRNEITDSTLIHSSLYIKQSYFTKTFAQQNVLYISSKKMSSNIFSPCSNETCEGSANNLIQIYLLLYF